VTKLKADVVLRCFRIVAAVTLLACGRCAPSIHDTHVPRRTTPLSRDNARLSFEVARPPFLIFYFGFEEIAEKFRRGVHAKLRIAKWAQIWRVYGADVKKYPFKGGLFTSPEASRPPDRRAQSAQSVGPARSFHGDHGLVRRRSRCPRCSRGGGRAICICVGTSFLGPFLGPFGLSYFFSI
jgi:hypothetical protein